MANKGWIGSIAAFAAIAGFIGILTLIPGRTGYESVARESIPKTVNITVDGTAKRVFLVLDKDGFSFKERVVAVRVGGSGVFISRNNHILTCNHLFDLVSVGTITVTDHKNESTTAIVLLQDEPRDLALIKADFKTTHKYAVLTSGPLAVGQEVIAVGSPLGLGFSVTHGIISFVDRNIKGKIVTQSDTWLNPGNSGGPLFNLDGELVGINSFMVPVVNAPVFTGLGFSVPPSEINAFLDTLRGL